MAFAGIYEALVTDLQIAPGFYLLGGGGKLPLPQKKPLLKKNYSYFK